MITCKFCNLLFNKNNIFKLHLLSKHKDEFKNLNELQLYYLSEAFNLTKDILDEIIKEYTNGYSLKFLSDKYNIDRRNIENYLLLNNIKIRNIKEANNCEVVKSSTKEYFINTFGVDNVSKLQSIKDKKKETFLKHYGYENNFCNKEILKKAKSNITEEIKKNASEKWKKTIKGRYNTTSPMKILEIAKKVADTQKQRFALMSTEEKFNITLPARQFWINKSRSSLEIKIETFLKKLNIKFYINKFLLDYNYDFILRDKKIILEIQGDYWHANPKIYNPNDIMCGGRLAKEIWKRDLKKKILAESRGYKVLYLWETEINQMSNKNIIKWIKNAISKN